MREFNAEERKLITYINNLCKRNLGPILFDSIIMETCFDNMNLVINFDKKEAFLKIDMDFYTQGGADIAIATVRKFNKTIITTINVIKSLQEYGLLISYFETQPKKAGIEEFGTLVHIQGEEKKSFEAQIYDTDTIQTLLDFSHKSIVGGEQLSNFVDRGFKTQDEKIHQVEINIAVIALIASTIIGIIELFHSSHEVHLLGKIYHLFKY